MTVLFAPAWLPGNLASLPVSVPFLLLILIAVIALKRRYATSIRDIPGPWLASISSLWQVYQLIKGHTEQEIVKLHRRHGPCISTGSPLHNSFTNRWNRQFCSHRRQ